MKRWKGTDGQEGNRLQEERMGCEKKEGRRKIFKYGLKISRQERHVVMVMQRMEMRGKGIK